MSGPLVIPPLVVAIVGSRNALPESLSFAEQLAFDLAEKGVVVVSGGARGVDAAAHRGALRAGGATWCVPPTGRNHVYPKTHAKLFDDIANDPRSRMIWAFPDDANYAKTAPRARNAVLVALANVVVVVQAYLKSGSRNAAGWARDLGRDLWVVPAAPWMTPFEGSLEELAHGARPLTSRAQLLRTLGLAPGSSGELFGPTARARAKISAGPSGVPSREGWTEDEKLIFSNISDIHKHVDGIATEAGISVDTAITSLLTLTLKDVVVEGPDGFFRRKNC